jgi:hypothetical protein
MDATPHDAERTHVDSMPRRLSAHDAHVLRAAFDRAFGSGTAAKQGRVSDDELRLALREACTQAHRQNVPAEQLIISIKQIWADLPAARTWATADAPEDLLGHVVSLCVDEYYGSSDS